MPRYGKQGHPLIATHHNAAWLVVLAGTGQTVLFKEDEIRLRVASGVLHDLSNLKLTPPKRRVPPSRPDDGPVVVSTPRGNRERYHTNLLLPDPLFFAGTRRTNGCTLCWRDTFRPKPPARFHLFEQLDF